MERNILIILTKSVYRLTVLFPKKDPLRYKIREVADDILASPKKEDFELISGFFEVAKEQNWVKVDDISSLQEQYVVLEQDILKGRESEINKAEPALAEEIKVNPQIVWSEPQPRNSKFCERHDKIMAFLKESGRAQVWQIKQILPDVSKRTLRRDFEFLVNQGTIERIGERNDTFYQIKLGQSQ